MLATDMSKTLIDVDQSRTRYDYITTEWRMYNCLDGIKAWAPELHHGFTTQGQPWWLGNGLGHLQGNLRTCGGRQLPPGASPSCRGSLINGWIWWPAEAEEINKRAPRSKGARTEPETGPKQARLTGLGQPAQAHFGPVRPRLAPRCFLVNC
jgi:hypothetical protein